ncbi:hypothetical protein OEZ86_005352 [Tetradesmus obliquus]|nr:hypothetical protein OEZ86_005352 [Tetradesmus obliquus]
MQAATGRKPGDSCKAALEHDGANSSSRALSGELSSNFRSFSIKSDLQQRTGPTKEAALLRAELELLRGQHAELAARLQLAEGQLGQQHRQLLQSRSSSGKQQDELSSPRDALQEADAPCTRAQCLAESAALQAVLLQCAWLAHYWELAHQFGLYAEVAASKAAYWRALAPPTSAIVQSAQHVCALLQQRKEQALYGHASSSSSSAACPGWQSRAAGTGTFPTSPHPTAADLVGIERGARQLQELGVEAAVMAALSQQAAARRTTLQLPPAAQEGCGLPLLAALLSPEEAGELALQAAYLAYLWGSAALTGLEPQVSVSRAEQWRARMDRQPCLRDFQDVRQGFQELRVLSIEQQMWQKRHSSKPLALPLRGSGSGGGVPVSKASKAAGLRTS